MYYNLVTGCVKVFCVSITTLTIHYSVLLTFSATNMATYDNILLFNITYNKKEISFKLSKYNTVADFKQEIYNKTGLEISRQSVDCWYRYPVNDESILEAHCLPFPQQNNLVVSVSGGTGNNETEPQTPADLSVNGTDFEKENDLFTPVKTKMKTGETETSSIISFLQYFRSNFDVTKSVSLNICCLEDAIKEACICPYDQRKVLVLYFHNKSTAFSHQFCTYLTMKNVKKALDDRFFFLGWDVEHKKFHPALLDAMHANNLSNYCEIVKTKSCCALLIVAIQDMVTAITCIEDRMSQEDLINSLKQAKKVLLKHKEIEEDVDETERESDVSERTLQSEPGMGSRDFQQLMLEYLGDRNYDKFDYYQHEELKEKIAIAYFGPLSSPSDDYDEKQKKTVEFIFRAILKQSNKVAKWKDRVMLSCIFNCTEPLTKHKTANNPNECDLRPVPLFVLRKCKNSARPCRIFVDNVGRVYESWTEYVEHNKLPECNMVLPKNGMYTADSQGYVILDEHLSPACKVDAKVLQAADVVSTCLGLASGGVFLADAVFGMVPEVLNTARVAGICVGLYALGRTAFSIYDKYTHEEDLRLTNPEARVAYLNILAGVLGFTGVSTGVLIGQMAANGYNVTQGFVTTVNLLNIANLGCNGLSVVNSGYGVLTQWKRDRQKPSLLTMFQLGSSILFFGHAVYNFKTPNVTRPEESSATEPQVLSELDSTKDYREIEKKMFLLQKMRRGSLREHHKHTYENRAEALAALRNFRNNAPNNDPETSNRMDMMREMFKMRSGGRPKSNELHLNGIKVDMKTLSSMNKGEIIKFLSALPNKPTVSDYWQKRKIMEMHMAAYEGRAPPSRKHGDVHSSRTREMWRWFPREPTDPECTAATTPSHSSRMWRWGPRKPIDPEPAVETTPSESMLSSGANKVTEVMKSLGQSYLDTIDWQEFGVKKMLKYIFGAWISVRTLNYKQDLVKKRKELHSTLKLIPGTQVACSKCGGLYYQPVELI